MDTAHNTRHAKHGTHTHHSATPRQHTRGWTRDPAPHTLHYSRVWAEKLRPCAHEPPQRRVTPACTHPPRTVSRASVMPREFESPEYRACESARARTLLKRTKRGDRSGCPGRRPGKSPRKSGELPHISTSNEASGRRISSPITLRRTEAAAAAAWHPARCAQGSRVSERNATEHRCRRRRRSIDAGAEQEQLRSMGTIGGMMRCAPPAWPERRDDEGIVALAARRAARRNNAPRDDAAADATPTMGI